MNTFEMLRSLQKITPEVIREIGVKSVHQNEKKVVLDSILENHPNYLTNRNTPSDGNTFLGNNIIDTRKGGNFTDWDDSGEYHDNLKFLEEQNIEFTSTGKGYEAIKANFSEDDYIAPTAKVLSSETMNAIKSDFINNIKNKLK